MIGVPSHILRFLVVALIVAAVKSANAELSGKDIVALPANERLEAVRAAIRQRAEQLSNLDIEVLVEERAVKFRDGQVSERRPFGLSQVFHLLRLNDSYKETCRQSNLHKGTADWIWETHYDAPSGTARGYTTIDDSEQSFARVSYQQETARRFNKHAYYLAGRINDDFCSHLETILVTPWTVSIEDALGSNGEVIVRMYPNPVPHGNSEQDIRIWLQPERGFSIRRYREEVRTLPSQEILLFEEGTVDKETEIDGVWLPFEITNLVGHLKKGTGGETIVTVKSASVGTVKPEDLEVVFPVGAEVTDNIQQKAYIKGEEEVTTVGFAGQKTYTSPRALLREAEAARPPGRPWYFWANLALVAALGIGLVVIRRRMKVAAG